MSDVGGEHGDRDIEQDAFAREGLEGSGEADEDVGLLGGGGPAATISDPDPEDEDAYRPDTDHSVR